MPPVPGESQRPGSSEDTTGGLRNRISMGFQVHLDPAVAMIGEVQPQHWLRRSNGCERLNGLDRGDPLSRSVHPGEASQFMGRPEKSGWPAGIDAESG